MEHKFGCIISPKDIRDYKIKARAMATYPVSFELEFNHNIKNQGQVGSCTAHATSEILEYYSKIPMSTNFIYTLKKDIANETSSGMSLLTACKVVYKYGDPTEATCPGNIEAPACFDKSNNVLTFKNKAEAYQYRIDSYYVCDNPSDIKYALMNYGPVLAAIPWYDSYYFINRKQIHFNKSTNFTYHAIMIYGWCKDGWLIQNSWGPNFGVNGCAILPFSDEITEARCLIDHDNSQDSKLFKPIILPNCVTKLINKVINFISPRCKSDKI